MAAGRALRGVAGETGLSLVQEEQRWQGLTEGMTQQTEGKTRQGLYAVLLAKGNLPFSQQGLNGEADP